MKVKRFKNGKIKFESGLSDTVRKNIPYMNNEEKEEIFKELLGDIEYWYNFHQFKIDGESYLIDFNWGTVYQYIQYTYNGNKKNVAIRLYEIVDNFILSNVFYLMPIDNIIDYRL